MVHPLEYGRAEKAPAWRRWILRSLIALGLIATLLALTMVPCRRVVGRVDPVTGSTMQQTEWLWGIRSAPRIWVSPLETRLKNSGVAWTPKWQFLFRTDYNIFGAALVRQCGAAPLVINLRGVPPQSIAKWTEEELREFLRIMQSGTDQEQRAAVQAAWDRAY